MNDYDTDFQKGISTSVAAPQGAAPVIEAAPIKVTEDGKPLVVPMKKRRYVQPDSDDESLATVKETSRKVTVKKQRQTEAIAQPDQKKKRCKAKEQVLQTDSKTLLKNMMPPHKQVTWLPLPGIDYSSPDDQVLNQDFWIRLLKERFNQFKFNDVLKKADFTEEQHEILHESFKRLSRHLLQIAKYSNHFMKIQKCLDCEFTVSHQCTPISDLLNIPCGAELMLPSILIPNRMILCICGFAVVHQHLKRSRRCLEPSTPSKLSPYLHELYRSTNVSCPKCYINMNMSNRTSDVCYDLANWNNTKDPERQRFYNSIVKHLHYKTPNTLSLDGFYDCSKGCCRLFHRCLLDSKSDSLGNTSLG